jgi:large subunit ribosomal protein L4
MATASKTATPKAEKASKSKELKLGVKTVAGKAAGSVELADDIFGIQPNVPVLHQVVTAQLAARRAGTQSTKTRAEVRGGGAKPWKQKGTGRARQGSIRSPQWVGGGIAHGPQPHGHEMRVNKKMKRGAMRSALTDALQSGKLAAIDDLSFDTPKTSEAAKILAALELTGKVLLVLPEPQDTVERSFRNLSAVRIAYAPSLGVYEILAADRVLFTGAALDILDARESAA